MSASSLQPQTDSRGPKSGEPYLPPHAGESVVRRTVVPLIVSLILTLFTLNASAADNKYGIAEKHTLTFDRDVRVGTVLLPAGDYQVRHMMSGEDHIMVFTQLNTKKPAEARAKCTLVPLDRAARYDEIRYENNEAEESVLVSLLFQGDRAEHVF